MILSLAGFRENVRMDHMISTNCMMTFFSRGIVYVFLSVLCGNLLSWRHMAVLLEVTLEGIRR